MDIAVALLCLVVAFPLMLALAVWIGISSRGPVIFVQERLGREGRPFRLYKFRTMTAEASRNDGGSWATTGDPRVTWFGEHLRKYHLDELPQFVNVINGSMSLVGPRPFRKVVHEQICCLEPRWGQRLRFRPGLTGYAQLANAKGESLEHHALKLDLDMLCAELTPAKYVWLLLKTPFKILTGSSH
jgi:lipopolysaccharide/colanic/teichoic acid biosynthesis glycosyltransferase